MEEPISKSLVADYDSSSSEDEESSIVETSKENQAVPLASATEMLNQNAGETLNSVFTNPYQMAENYEQSVLEKHVKMTKIKEQEIKNRKVCYKFNKGKCMMGDRCQYLHHNPTLINDSDNRLSDDPDDSAKTLKAKTKKRSGLKDDLVPPKKFMKIYNKHK